MLLLLLCWSQLLYTYHVLHVSGYIIVLIVHQSSIWKNQLRERHQFWCFVTMGNVAVSECGETKQGKHVSPIICADHTKWFYFPRQHSRRNLGWFCPKSDKESLLLIDWDSNWNQHRNYIYIRVGWLYSKAKLVLRGMCKFLLSAHR